MRKIKFEKGGIYHVCNRGVEKREIFMEDPDRWRFLQGMFLFNSEKSSIHLLWELERKNGKATFRTLKNFFMNKPEERFPLVRIIADCLMTNHYHLLLEEFQENGISRFMQKLGTGYAQYFNKKYKRVGSLFQGRFRAVRVEKDLHLQYLTAYINVLNPGQLIEPLLKEKGVENVEAILKFAKEYPWSTHKEYLGERNSFFIDKGVAGRIFETPRQYREYVRAVVEGKKSLQNIQSFLLD